MLRNGLSMTKGKTVSRLPHSKPRTKKTDKGEAQPIEKPHPEEAAPFGELSNCVYTGLFW